jgi:hypothetical protein
VSVDCVKLLRLVLGNFQHLHGEYAEIIFFELLDYVADRILPDGVGLNDGQSTLQSFHSFFWR